MPEDRRMTFIVVPHGRDPTTRSFEVSYARLRGLAIAGAVTLLLVMVMAGSWLWLAAQAARVPGLTAEVVELRGDRAQMEELARTVERLSADYARVRVMLGADSVALPALVDEPDGAADAEDDGAEAAVDTTARSFRPHRWPLAARGYTTRGHLAARGSHAGMDIAVPAGSRILASGSGAVAEVGEDSVYGRYVRIAHGGGYESLYAHANEVLVREDEPVGAGRVIALSGSTGASTAPHLHFEIRKDGRPVDPGALVQNPN
jgi:murein DD-endopeptidase MepM/ murein hydrolase activator NlpD